MTETQVANIINELDSRGLTTETLTGLRSAHPKVQFTHCLADDLEDRQPYAERSTFKVYLLSSDGHCLSITPHLGDAVGIVLAEV